MPKNHNKVAGNPEHDATLPKTPIKLGKETYYLCYNFRALSLAESKLRNVGVECNILKSLDPTELDATKLATVLFAGLLAHKPNITFDEVLSLIDFKNMFTIPGKIMEAYGPR
jgi:hypothetical protein